VIAQNVKHPRITTEEQTVNKVYGSTSNVSQVMSDPGAVRQPVGQ